MAGGGRQGGPLAAGRDAGAALGCISPGDEHAAAVQRQRIFTAQATALAIFTLLALGTFTAGIQVLSWQVCLLGLIMALGIPAIAWIENSALLVVLIVGAVIGVGAVLWWYWRQHFARAR